MFKIKNPTLPGRSSSSSHSRGNNGSEPHRGSAAQTSKPSLRILLSITSEDAKRHVAQLFHAHGIPLLCELRAKGTAPTEFLDILGLGGTTRILTAGYADRSQIPEIMDGMKQALAYGRRGTGIAVSIPLDAAQGALVRLLAREVGSENGISGSNYNVSGSAGKEINSSINANQEMDSAGVSTSGTPVEDTDMNEQHQTNVTDAINEKNADTDAQKIGYTLLWTSVVSGYSDDVVKAARAVGARGGTILHGNRSGENTIQDLGFDGQQEQDFVMIIVPSDKKTTVMQAIIKACGLNTSAKGVAVALPVEDAVGLA